jgi:hypothetical protein
VDGHDRARRRCGHRHLAERRQPRWIDETSLATVTTSATVTLRPTESDAHGKKALRIPLESSSYDAYLLELLELR